MNISQRFPFWISPIFAVVFIWLYYALIGEPDFPNRTFFMLFFLAAFVAMAVITPLQIIFRKEIRLSPWYPLALSFFCALLLFGYFMLGGSRETYGYMELPHFGYRFPVLGSILDAVVISLGVRKEAYFPPGYGVILWAGLFIEIVLVSAIIYAIISYTASRQDTKADKDTRP